jgi:hypothetical protein
VSPQTFNFTQQELMNIQNYRDQEVQTLSNITNKTLISGPRITMQEVTTDHNVRMVH